MDPGLLARIQFGLTIGFHYIFPPLSIGLGIILVVMESLYLGTKDELYHRMTRFWVGIFGLIFALGVATGIVMEFQFGTNWSSYSRFVGDVFGSALAAEGIFAFFLESGFLAILLFGWDKVRPRTHFLSTVLVCLGAHLSAVWIVAANSWQQTPAGHHLVAHNGMIRAEVVDYWKVILNPSFLDRISHTFMGAWQAGAFLVISVSAYYLIKDKHVRFARQSIKISLVVAVVASISQLITGHSSGVTVGRTQPAKLAAFEGHFQAHSPADIHLFGWVDEEDGRVIGPRIPGMLSYLVHGDAEKPVTGLLAFPPQDRPPVNPVFQSFHFMVAIGMVLIALSVTGLLGWWRGWLFEKSWLLWIFVFSVLLPQFANQLGWFSAEMGRQPWVVYGLMRTSDGISTNVTSGQIILSLILFSTIYLLLLALFIFLLDNKIRKGPGNIETPEGHMAT